MPGPEGISGLIPIETFVPETHREWRPIVRDAMQFVFSRLSHERLAGKIGEQARLPPDTPPEQRLIRLIAKMPGLQKLGQVLARNRRLAPAVREALCELENGLSDVTASEMHAIIRTELGQYLREYRVKLAPRVHKEGSASAIVKFTWNKPGREPQAGAFKVLKPYVPEYFAEDMRLLQGVGEYLAVPDVKETISEVRTLLDHELDFRREQATLIEASRMYRSSFGIRVPGVIQPLCTERITAMTAEHGIKVTDVFRRSPFRRERIAQQVIGALIAIPLFSRESAAIFHADPHAGNVLYDEPNRELVILDWALTDRLSLAARRHVIMLAVMVLLRKPEGVVEAICALSRGGRRALIERHVKRFFADVPPGHSRGVLDAMKLLDELALKGVRFPSALFMFRKVLFTLDGVLHDIAGPDVQVDQVIVCEFLTRCLGSLGVFHAPLKLKDLLLLAQALVLG